MAVLDDTAPEIDAAHQVAQDIGAANGVIKSDGSGGISTEPPGRLVPDGGTDGQVLQKASPANGDTQWASLPPDEKGVEAVIPAPPITVDDSDPSAPVIGIDTSGIEPADPALQAHLTDTSNPHAVTAAQVGAEPADPAIQGHLSDTSNPHGVDASQIGAEPADPGIQDHIAATDNPHGVSPGQVGNTVAQWNASKLRDVTVDLTGIATGQVLKFDGSQLSPADDIEGGGGQVEEIVAASPITVDSGDPTKPIVGIDGSAYEPSNPNIQGHIAATDNPHAVTAAQTGAATPGDLDAKVNKSGDTMTGDIVLHFTNPDGMPMVSWARADGSIMGRARCDSEMIIIETLNIDGSVFNQLALKDNGQLVFNDNRVWHEGNDGDGSNLDAGLLAGEGASYYAKSGDLSSHTGDLSNPHAVDMSQVGITDGDLVPAGGTTGQSLQKATDTDGDTVWATPPSGVTVFTGLSDTPPDYADAAGKAVYVNDDETGLQYVDSVKTELLAAPYKFSSTVDGSDPGSGRVSANNSDYTLVTEICVNDVDRTGKDQTMAMMSLDNGDFIAFQDANSEKHITCLVTGPTVDNSTYFAVPVLYKKHSGAFNNGERLNLNVLYVGIRGVTVTAPLQVDNSNPHHPALSIDGSGYEPSDPGIQDHIAATDNPHGVTAAQAGAEPADSNIQAHISATDNPHSVTAGQVGNTVAQWNANQMHSIPVDTTGLSNGQILKFDGTSFVPAADEVGSPGGGVVELVDGVAPISVDNADITHPIVSIDGSGYEPADPDLQAHLGLTDNPHGVTAAQVGAPTQAALDGHVADVANPHAVTTAQVGAEPANTNIQGHIGTTSGNPHQVTAAEVGAPTQGALDGHIADVANPHAVTAGQAGAEPANSNIQAHISSTGNPHATSFLKLTDTPADFTDAAGKAVCVTDGADGLKFMDLINTGVLTAEYAFSADVTGAEPAAGVLSVNDADYSLITELYINYLDGDGKTIAYALAALGNGDIVSVHDINSGTYFTLGVTGAPVDNTTYYTLPVVYKRHSGALADGAAVFFNLAYIGMRTVSGSAPITVNNADPHHPVIGIDGSGYEPANPNIQTHISATDNPHGVTAGQAGAEPANSNIQAHIGTVAGNPHVVTAAEVGAPTQAALDGHIADVANPHAVTASQAGAEPANGNIQGHIAATDNPHGVTAGQVGNGSAQWNANQLQTIPISDTAPVDGQILKYNGTEYAPAADNVGTPGGQVDSVTGTAPITVDNADPANPVVGIDGSGYEPANSNIQAHISATDNPHGVTAGQTGSEPANANIQGHIADTTGNPHAVTTGMIGAAAAADLTAHTGNVSNPHVVTAAQAGAEPANSNIQGHIADMGNPHGITALEINAGLLHVRGSWETPNVENPLVLDNNFWNAGCVFYGIDGVIDLPPASVGGNLVIHNTGDFTITINPSGDECIVRDGFVQTGGVSIILSPGAGNFVVLMSDGYCWITGGRNGDLTEGTYSMRKETSHGCSRDKEK